MALNITFDNARTFVRQERVLLHAWATKRPFAFGLLCAAATVFVCHWI
jgi:hypothetical protein